MSGSEEVIAALNGWGAKKLAGLYALANGPIGKGLLEAEAKLNAPWIDRTGLARKGLHGGAERDGTDLVIYVAHSKNIPYGIYLELANAGKYAILKPTIERNLERIKQVLKEYWENPG